MKRSGKSAKIEKSESGASALATLTAQVRDVPARLEQAAAALGKMRRRTERLVKKNPLGALAGASAVGFVVAKLK